ncbi:uncharacterized protein [Eleutherodactylus coqui]|uniref:uncharacterized protein isoform X2 n=1 Tax=Eleutherodactylus coqui TaxID=57060 RepID=UPI00346212C9
MFKSSAIGFITTEMTQHRMMTILPFVCLSLCFEALQAQMLYGDPCIYSDDCESRCCFRDSPKGSGKCVSKSTPYVKCYGPNEANPCFYSHQCHSGCCFPGRTAKDATCVHKNPESRKCLGPNNNDLCYANENCNSGCCYGIDNPWIFYRCGPKVKTESCFGSDNGDPCALSEYCKSGCCKNSLMNSGRCSPKAKENVECDPETHNGFYKHNCPCESGLICEMDTECIHESRIGPNTGIWLLTSKQTRYKKPNKSICKNPNRRICKKPNTPNKCL